MPSHESWQARQQEIGRGPRGWGVLVLTCLAGVAVLALDEAPAAAGENGIPNAHCRRRISRIPTLSVSFSAAAGAAERRFLGRAAGAGYLELEQMQTSRWRVGDGSAGQEMGMGYMVVLCQCQGSSIFCLYFAQHSQFYWKCALNLSQFLFHLVINEDYTFLLLDKAHSLTISSISK